MKEHPPLAHAHRSPHHQTNPNSENFNRKTRHPQSYLWKYILFSTIPLVLFLIYYYTPNYKPPKKVETIKRGKIQTSLLPSGAKPNSELPASVFQNSRQFTRKDVAVTLKSNLRMSFISRPQPTTTLKGNPNVLSSKQHNKPHMSPSKCGSVIPNARIKSTRYTLWKNPLSSDKWSLRKPLSKGIENHGHCDAKIYLPYKQFNFRQISCYSSNGSLSFRTFYCFKYNTIISYINHSITIAGKTRYDMEIFYDMFGNEENRTVNPAEDTSGNPGFGLAVHERLTEFDISVGLGQSSEKTEPSAR